MSENKTTQPQEELGGASDDPRVVRQAKREALIAAGQNPYGHAFDKTHSVATLIGRYASLGDGETTEDRVAVAGRIMARRVQGKIAFLELRDSGADIQLFCRINNLGEEAYAALVDLDVGDWIGVVGTMMRTKRGQLSIAVDSFELLSKSLRPLPEKFHGLQDKELRYRQRYVDLIMNPEVRLTFEQRFAILSAIRSYMDSQGFVEVETPFLQPILGGANARPFVTHHQALDRDFYLRIATELHLKRLLVGGFERVYELGRQFRNEGMDPYHNPEFTTLEAYQAFSDLEGMKTLTQGCIQAAARAAYQVRQRAAMQASFDATVDGDEAIPLDGAPSGETSADDELSIIYQGQTINLGGTWRSASMIDLATEAVGEPIDFTRSVEELTAVLKRLGGTPDVHWGQGKLIAEIFDAAVESTLIEPTFVNDYPLEISPLARKNPDDPRLTLRFELFIAGHEYANAFSELNDPVDQAERFHAQVAAKDMGDDEAMGYDADYIRALEYGMPPAGGVGIGIDRLVMLLTDAPSIRDVLLFPHMRDE